jgi:hypothetical protein
MGIPHLVRSKNILNLVDQRPVKTIGLIQGVKTSVKGIPTVINLNHRPIIRNHCI